MTINVRFSSRSFDLALVPSSKDSPLLISLLSAGLQVGDEVRQSGQALAVELGPGLLAHAFDGIQRPFGVRKCACACACVHLCTRVCVCVCVWGGARGCACAIALLHLIRAFFIWGVALDCGSAPYT